MSEDFDPYGIKKHNYKPIRGGTRCEICGMAKDYCGKTVPVGEYERQIRNAALEEAALVADSVVRNSFHGYRFDSCPVKIRALKK